MDILPTGIKPKIREQEKKSLQDIYAEGVLAAQQLSQAETQQLALAKQKEEQRLADLARRQALAFQQGRQQISEQSFDQQRALLQGAAARGLGGSGLQQLAQVQQRMETGKQISALSQQQALGAQNVSEQLALAAQSEQAGLSKIRAEQAGTEYELASKLYAGETEAERYQAEQAAKTEEQSYSRGQYDVATKNQAYDRLLDLIQKEAKPEVIKAALAEAKNILGDTPEGTARYNELVLATGGEVNALGEFFDKETLSQVYKERWFSGGGTVVTTLSDGSKGEVITGQKGPADSANRIREKYVGSPGFDQITVVYDPNSFGRLVDYVFVTRDGQKFKNYKEALAYVRTNNPPAWSPEDLLRVNKAADQLLEAGGTRDFKFTGGSQAAAYGLTAELLNKNRK